jgi:hypothetical protein
MQIYKEEDTTGKNINQLAREKRAHQLARLAPEERRKSGKPRHLSALTSAVYFIICQYQPRSFHVCTCIAKTLTMPALSPPALSPPSLTWNRNSST